MEFFNKAKAVRLKSHLGKYLVADDDEQTVRQSRRSGASRKARWSVEPVAGNPHAVRLKSCHGRYLTASDEAYLLGMTGKKVLQTIPDSKKDVSIEWEPIKEGYNVKLRTKGGKFLRANGATPPWRNSITHDLPHRTATQDWVLWEVDAVDVSVLDDEYLSSNESSFDSSNDLSYPNSPAVGPERGAAAAAAERLWRPSFMSRTRRPSILSDRSSPNNCSSPRAQDGMEFFSNAKAVRLQSHLGKYLVADEDELTVRQSRNGASHRARWTVEHVDGKRDRIRLKSCHGLYLTASEEPFLLGMTGKKVLQCAVRENENHIDEIEWRPVKEGTHVKLMTSEEKFLRANGGAPPWRNSVTHDVPHRTATQSWVLWGVEIVDITVTDLDSDSGCLSVASSFNSVADDYSGSPDTGSPVVRNSGWDVNTSMKQLSLSNDYECLPDTEFSMDRHSGRGRNISTKRGSGMEFFRKAKSVRLKSHHDKYLKADSDEETVVQDRSAGTSRSAKWEVEFVEDVENVIRLRSCYGKYLKASDQEFLLGVTGRRVLQSRPPKKLDSSFEWEPIRDGMQVKLRTRYGNYLRANGGLPPWRNSITHDIPHRHREWILWEVDVIEILPESPKKDLEPAQKEEEAVVEEAAVEEEEEEEDDLSAPAINLRFPSHTPSRSSLDGLTKKAPEGRVIYYYVADDNGDVNDAIEEESFQFKGHGLEQLSQKLEEETGLEDIIVCSRNIVNGKLYPLRLALPPNNATMHVVVVPPTSRVASEFLPPAPAST